MRDLYPGFRISNLLKDYKIDILQYNFLNGIIKQYFL